MTDYLLEISFDPDFEEVVQAHLFLTRSLGNFSPNEGAITAYFESARDRDAAADLLRDLPVTLAFREQPRTDWLEQYQQSLQPLFIGRSFVAAPERSLIPSDTPRHPLIIPQEQAFGTGSHESTALTIELLEEVDVDGACGLDIGSGSGILGLAMLRLGARKVMAFDNDLDAFGPLRDNRARNEVAPSRMPLFIGTVETRSSRRFDIATMNIVPEVIVRILPFVNAEIVILAGILITQRDDILAACRDLQLVAERERGEWWAGRFARIR